MRDGNVVRPLWVNLCGGIARSVVAIPDQQIAVSSLGDRLGPFVTGGKLDTIEG